MKAQILRSALALTSAVFCLSVNAQAEELNFSDLEARLARIEARLGGTGIQQASCCTDVCCGDSCCSDPCCGTPCCSDPCCGDPCCGSPCCGDCCTACPSDCGGMYGEIQMVWARLHTTENTILPKTSENYDFSPRFVFGYENGCGQGARLRWWLYDHDTAAGPNTLAVNLNIVDIEGTQRFQGRRTDVTFAGGVRFFSADLSNNGGPTSTADLYGLTFAADIETLLCCDCNSYWSLVYGARLSLLGGDWKSAGGVVAAQRDDNVVGTEIYAGVEYGYNHCGYDIYTRLAYEIQNFDSNVLDSQAAAGQVAFVGPSWHVGFGF